MNKVFLSYLTYFGIFTLFCPISLQSETQKKEVIIPALSTTGPITIQVSGEFINKPNNTNINTNNNEAASTNSLSAANQTIIKYFQQISYAQIKEEVTTKTIDLHTFVTEYCKANKAKIALISLGTVYSIIWYKLLYCAHTILSQTNWASWKNSIPFDMLHIMPQQELAKELLFALQKHYQTTENLTDFLLPLVSFLRDVDHELRILNQFLMIHHWLEKCHLSFLFPQQEILVQRAHEKVNRLSYLKEIFLDWVTDYKITINTPS